MKIVLFFVFSILAIAHLHAQVKTAKGQAHVLYLGVENNLGFILDRYDTAIIDIKRDQFNVVDFSASSGELIYQYAFNTLIWKACEKTEDSVTIDVYDKRTQKTIDLVTLKVTTLPDPTIVIPSSRHKLFWGRKELYENNVTAAFSAPGMKFKCEILAFTIQLQTKDGLFKEYQNEGRDYTDKAIGLMSQFQKGDTAWFSNFEVRCGCEDHSRVLTDKLRFVRVGEIIKVERGQ